MADSVDVRARSNYCNCKVIAAEITAAVQQEREACATIADQHEAIDDHCLPDRIAAAIRKGGHSMKSEISRLPKHTKDGGWWYEDLAGIRVLSAAPGGATQVRILWKDLLLAAKRCGRLARRG